MSQSNPILVFIFEQLVRATQKLNIRLHKEYGNLKKEKFNVNVHKKEKLMIDLMNFVDNTIDLIRYVKPYKGHYKHNDYENNNHKYYDEREWRYVPPKQLAKSFITKKEWDFKENRKIHNGLMEYITFDHHDLTDIIVPQNEVQEIRDFVAKQPHLKSFNLDKINTLQNKLTK